MKREICYFVDEIESSFVMQDILRISEKFDHIYLVSTEKLEYSRSLPANVIVIDEFLDWKRFDARPILVRHFTSVLMIYLRECMALKKFLPFKQGIGILVSNIFKANEALKNLVKARGGEPTGDMIFYSFWFYDCNYLAWMKKKRLAKKTVSRAHAGDIYEQGISLKGNILFRNFQMRYLDAVFPISNAGTSYLKSKYRNSKAKIKTIFLGSNDQGMLNAIDNDKFVLVSCASLRHHKRIHIIAEALRYIDFPLTWYHFGDENLHTDDPSIPEYLRQKDLLQQKNNITFIPKGYIENEKILEFYKKNPVNLFISVSQSEGIPVSIMEAISFGIPVLSTDVGGCREIVTDETGILIPPDTAPSEIAHLVEGFKNSRKNTMAYRQSVRKFWERNFDANKNYSDFFESILN